MRKTTMLVACVSLCLTVVMMSSPAFATKKPSEDTCKQIGDITVKCYDCETKAFLKTVKARSQYDSYSKSCVDHRYARKLCREGLDGDVEKIGLTYQFWLGLTQYTSKSPCLDR